MPVAAWVKSRINEFPAVGDVGIANVQGVEAVSVAVTTVPAVMTIVAVPVTVPRAATDSTYPEIVGVVSVGDVPKTFAPVPVSSVSSAARFALDGVPRKVRAPAAVVVVDGATPAPPPITSALAVRAAEEAMVPAAVNARMPPEVPVVSPVPPLATGNAVVKLKLKALTARPAVRLATETCLVVVLWTIGKTSVPARGVVLAGRALIFESAILLVPLLYDTRTELRLHRGDGLPGRARVDAELSKRRVKDH
jgi:hypothetical protein